MVTKPDYTDEAVAVAKSVMLELFHLLGESPVLGSTSRHIPEALWPSTFGTAAPGCRYSENGRGNPGRPARTPGRPDITTSWFRPEPIEALLQQGRVKV